MGEIYGGKKIILFDGVCNFCNATINKLIKLDKKDMFLFCSLQSDTGKKIVSDLKIDTSKIDSIILFEPGLAYYIKSTAALEVINSLGGFWSLFNVFYIFPSNIRDILYDFIAKNRYKWFGKSTQCMMPTPELKSKFLM